jgi:type III secretory pathway lipoprotein EscJ
MYSLLNTNLEEKIKYKSMIEEKIKQGLNKVLVVFSGMIMVQTNWILGLN